MEAQQFGGAPMMAHNVGSNLLALSKSRTLFSLTFNYRDHSSYIFRQVINHLYGRAVSHVFYLYCYILQVHLLEFMPRHSHLLAQKGALLCLNQSSLKS